MFTNVFFKLAITAMVIGMIRFLAIVVARTGSNSFDGWVMFWLAVLLVQTAIIAILAAHLRPRKK